MYVSSWCCTCFCVVLFVRLCTGHFIMVPLNLTYLHCLQHYFFDHLFNLYFHLMSYMIIRITSMIRHATLLLIENKQYECMQCIIEEYLWDLLFNDGIALYFKKFIL